MNKGNTYISVTIQNTGWHWLLRISLILFFFLTFLQVKAQCPTAVVIPTAATICSGSSAAIELTSNQPGTEYSWTTVQTNVVGAMDARGASVLQVLTATAAIPGSVTYTITPFVNGCKGEPVVVSISVMPIPVISASPLTSTLFSGNNTAIELMSDADETEFSWTVIQSGVSGAIRGTGSVISQTLTTTADKGIATYRITPALKGCAGESINAKVIVNKQP